jgi:hypothetical protein
MVRLTSPADELVLLDLLNTTPVVEGTSVDLLGSDDEAFAWARSRTGIGSGEEAWHLRLVRDQLQAVVRGAESAVALQRLLDDVRLVPVITDSGVTWSLDIEEHEALGTCALLAWGHVQEQMPGRLRACANVECRLFLLDRSRPNTARWCSMRTCGNRLKARRHYRRAQRAG